MHHDAYSSREARVLKPQDEQLPDPTRSLAKYALDSGNKAAILLRYMKEFQTELIIK